MSEFIQTYRYSCIGGFVGFLLALLIISVGFIQTLVVLLFIILGVIIGFYLDKNDVLANLFK